MNARHGESWIIERDAETVKSVEVPCCVVCGSRCARPVSGIEESGFGLMVCGRCGVGRCHPFPDRNQLRDFYSADYYGGAKDGKFHHLVEAPARRVGARRAHRLAKGLRQGERILDLGCGRGTMLSAFADIGLEVHGIEVSERAARGADPRAEIRIVEELSDACYPPEFFDMVVVWHVLEHLVDPRATLREIHRILKPHGQLVVAVPNFSSAQARWAGPDWFHLDLPRHLYHFPLGALRRLIEGCGFRRVRTRHFSFSQNPFGWVQSALNRCRRLPRNGLYLALQADGEAAGYSVKERAYFQVAFWGGMPLALGLSMITALLRTGATVNVRAEKSLQEECAELSTELSIETSAIPESPILEDTQNRSK